MDALHMQAMLVRHFAAMNIVQHYDEEGRWDLLRMVVDPDEATLEASLKQAEHAGLSRLSYDMSVRAASEKARRRTYSFG